MTGSTTTSGADVSTSGAADDSSASGSTSGDDDGTSTGGEPDAPPPTVHEGETYDVEVSTVVYAEGLEHSDWTEASTGTVELRLDVYEPVDAPPGRPAMMMIHGGGFVGGSRTDNNMVAFAEYFASRGWVAMSIDYRLAGVHGTVPDAWAELVQAVVPAQQRNQAYALYPAARDAKAAMRWLHAHAEDYGIDTRFVTTLGGSAGSYLAIMLGVTDPEDFRDEISPDDDPTLATTNLESAADVHTIIDHWGGLSHMEILELLDGQSRFDDTDAPVSIVHGTADATVAFAEAETLRDAYVETGVAFDFHPLEGAGHGAWGSVVDGMTLDALAFGFVLEQQALTVVP